MPRLKPLSSTGPVAGRRCGGWRTVLRSGKDLKAHKAGSWDGRHTSAPAWGGMAERSAIAIIG